MVAASLPDNLEQGASAAAAGRGGWPILAGLICCLALSAPFFLWQAIDWSQRQAYEQLSAAGQDRLRLYEAALHSELEKSRNVPMVLANDPVFAGFLGAADGPRRDDQAFRLDRRLQALNDALGFSAIYLLDRQGLTLAASNWDEGSGSFVGQNFAFRPYFTQAMEGREGRYFALGSTSNIPGFYLALPVRQDDRIVGAVVVKTAMDALEHGWSGGGEKVFVTDRSGIVFLTNVAEWRFSSQSALDPQARQAILSSRQYGDATLAPLGLVTGSRLTSVAGKSYVMVSKTLEDGDGWTLHVLLDVGVAEERARDFGLLVMAAAALAAVVVGFAIHRARLVRRHTRELERRVAERTTALVESNRCLQAEVVERRRAEDVLRAKQEELVQATKLAALGQMSAGMAHEVNQPLAAIRSFADNAKTLLSLGRAEEVHDNLMEIADLTERMARMTGLLKQFARKSSGFAESVSLERVVSGALSLLGGRLKDDAVAVRWELPAETALSEVSVWGDEVRLQQVLINLLRNALDAMRKVERRQLVFSLALDENQVRLSLQDSGPGIAPEAMARIFEPFFTTKPAGEGTGLGLSISEGIVRDLGGRLSARNAPAGGAIFTLSLRRMERT